VTDFASTLPRIRKQRTFGAPSESDRNDTTCHLNQPLAVPDVIPCREASVLNSAGAR
jgi:hypothetical protein